MRQLLAVLVCLISVNMLGQALDYDGNDDGCVNINDLLGLLTEVGQCEDNDSFTCGDLIEYEGYNYSTVQIGDQCWFAENCRYLPTVSLPSSMDWAPHAFVLDYMGTDVATAMATDAYSDYGVLYNWHALTQWDLCPAGWHMTTDEDWMIMEAAIGVPENELESTGFRGDDQGEQLKDSVMWNGTDSYGMAVRAGGQTFTTGAFGNEGATVHIWVATEYSTLYPWHRGLTTGSDGVYRNNNVTKSIGGYGRCVKD